MSSLLNFASGCIWFNFSGRTFTDLTIQFSSKLSILQDAFFLFVVSSCYGGLCWFMNRDISRQTVSNHSKCLLNFKETIWRACKGESKRGPLQVCWFELTQDLLYTCLNLLNLHLSKWPSDILTGTSSRLYRTHPVQVRDSKLAGDLQLAFFYLSFNEDWFMRSKLWPPKYVPQGKYFPGSSFRAAVI